MLILTLLLFLYTISDHLPEIPAKKSMENQAIRCDTNMISKKSINILVAVQKFQVKIQIVEKLQQFCTL